MIHLKLKRAIINILFIYLLYACNIVNDTKTKIIRYENGDIQAEIQLKNNKKHGVAKLYHANGNLESIQSYINDTIYGDAFFYNSFGELEKYSFFNFDGELLFDCIYYEDSLVMDGQPIFISIEKGSLDDIYINKEINIVLYGAKPPRIKHLISFFTFENNYENYIIQDKYPVYNVIFDNPGKKQIKVISRLIKDKTLYKSDTLIWNVLVTK